MKLGVIEFPSCLHIASSLGYMDITSQLGKGWVPPTVIQLWNEDVAHLAAKQARKKNAREATSMGASFCGKRRVRNVTSQKWLYKNTQTDDFGDLFLDSGWIWGMLVYNFLQPLLPPCWHKMALCRQQCFTDPRVQLRVNVRRQELIM